MTGAEQARADALALIEHLNPSEAGAPMDQQAGLRLARHVLALADALAAAEAALRETREAVFALLGTWDGSADDLGPEWNALAVKIEALRRAVLARAEDAEADA